MRNFGGAQAVFIQVIAANQLINSSVRTQYGLFLAGLTMDSEFVIAYYNDYNGSIKILTKISNEVLIT